MPEGHQAEGFSPPTPKNPYSIRRVHFSLALVQLGYGGCQVLTKVALTSGLSPFVFSIYRNLIAFVLVAPFAYFIERKERPNFTVSTFFQFNVLALTGIVGSQQLFMTGLSLTSPMFAAVSQNMIPVFTFVIAASFGLEEVCIRRRDGIAKVVGTVICVGGAVLKVVYKGTAIISVCLILQCLSWAGYLILQMVVVAVLSVLFLGESLYLGTILGGIVTVAGLYLVVSGQGHERRLKRATSSLKLRSAPAKIADLEQPLLS